MSCVRSVEPANEKSENMTDHNMPLPESAEVQNSSFGHPGLARRRLLVGGSTLVGLLAIGRGSFASAATKKKTTTKKRTATTKKATGTTTGATAVKEVAKGSAFESGLELAITYTFASAESGGRFRNPYTAVWIEDPNGSVVRTVDLSVQLGKGLRWLNELRRWYSVDSARIANGGADQVETISSATRVAGTYDVVWDGKDDKGAVVSQGAYVLCIEASRERGPYGLARHPLSIDSTPFSKTFAGNGELTAVVVKLRAKA
jgi:hypothetical protein